MNPVSPAEPRGLHGVGELKYHGKRNYIRHSVYSKLSHRRLLIPVVKKRTKSFFIAAANE